MTDVSITTKGITFTFENGEVDKVTSSIQTGIENSEVTQAGPMGSYNYDFEGVKKIITINGTLFESSSSRTSTGTVTTLLAQKQWLESLCNGDQGDIEFNSNYESQSVFNSLSATSPYVSSFTSTKVMIDSMNFSEVTGDPERIRYQISFKVGQP